MDILQLTDTAFPRLKNIYSWFKKKKIDLFQKDSGPCYIGKPHILLLRTKCNENSDLNLFSQEEATLIDKKHLSSSTGSCVESYLNRFSYQRVPVLLLCLLRIDKQGHIEKQDKRLLSYIVRHCSRYKDMVVLYMVDGTTDFNLELKKLSFEIQKKMDTDNITNDIFCRTFKVSERKLKEGIGLYLEQSLTRYILEVAENSLKTETMECTSTLKIRNRFYKSNALEHMVVHDWKEVVLEFKPCKPDSCEMHELEVLLERTKDVSAYGFDDDGLTIFVKTLHQVDNLKLYLNKYYHGKATEIHIKVWDAASKISKYNLKQGSKVARTDGKFGTLGLFLTDQTGNTYFTTCSHVIEKHENAYNNLNSVIGKSVHAVNTGHDMAHDDLVDLSVIKADQSIVRHCQFGLRSTTDEFIEGEIIGAQVIKSERMKSLKVYKWGAKSGLTRGTYKGWISRKDQNDRFDHNLHKIVCDTNQFFEEGDSGSLVCFEATGSPQFQNETVAYIFVGKLVSSKECQLAQHPQENMYYCYHVSNVFDCTIGDSEIKPCLSPNSSVGRYATGTSIES
ncbi:unnamed protein product [Mytilus coruscus]|uniref:Uncharacterized protein n=1 Tax=Mytilus coruscus TaxID=42192 RepID=A0A6J8A9S1_MYTCO|nr:unnamed protein product [Mytilus coruscus]